MNTPSFGVSLISFYFCNLNLCFGKCLFFVHIMRVRMGFRLKGLRDQVSNFSELMLLFLFRLFQNRILTAMALDDVKLNIKMIYRRLLF